MSRIIKMPLPDAVVIQRQRLRDEEYLNAVMWHQLLKINAMRCFQTPF